MNIYTKIGIATIITLAVWLGFTKFDLSQQTRLIDGLARDNGLLFRQNDSLKKEMRLKDSIGWGNGCAIILELDEPDNDIKSQ